MSPVNLLLMENTSEKMETIKKVYDLKGSLINRANNNKSALNKNILMDLDFI